MMITSIMLQCVWPAENWPKRGRVGRELYWILCQCSPGQAAVPIKVWILFLVGGGLPYVWRLLWDTKLFIFFRDSCNHQKSRALVTAKGGGGKCYFEKAPHVGSAVINNALYIISALVEWNNSLLCIIIHYITNALYKAPWLILLVDRTSWLRFSSYIL